MKDNLIMIYAIIPSELYKTKKLTPEEKLIAERITALCCKDGSTWVSNNYLSILYGVRSDTISKHIKKLERYGYIKCKYDKQDNKSKRIIYLTDNIWDKYNNTNSINNKEKIDHLSEHNNKNNNKNNIKIISKGPTITFKDGKEYWNGKLCDSNEIEDSSELDNILLNL